MSNIDPNILIATHLDALITNTHVVVKNALNKGFKLLSEADDPQAVLDSFGTNAVVLFSQYETYRQVLSSFGESIEPATGSFAPQPDGTVIYTAPDLSESS